MTNRNINAFTITEVIIVVAIVGMLSAIAVPLLIGYLEDSNQTVCYSNMTEVNQKFAIRLNSSDHTTSNDQFKLLQDTVKSFNGQVLENGHDFAQICPAGGKYISFFNNQSGAICLYCDKHGVEQSRSLSRSDYFHMISANSALADEFSSLPAEKKAAGVIHNQGDGSHISAEITAILEANGINVYNSSWALLHYKKDDEEVYNIYWSDSDISVLSDGTVIAITVYDVLTCKSYSATATVIRGANGKMMLDVENCVIISEQTDSH